MAIIKEIIIFFLLSLSFGTMLFSNITPSKLTGAGFLRLVTTIGMATLVVSLIIISTLGISLNAIYISAGLILLLQIVFYKFHKDESNTMMQIIFWITISMYLVLFYFYQNQDNIKFLYLVLSGLFIGSVNYAMTLGHYYLVVPRLSEWPLLKTMKYFWVILAIKVLVSIFGYMKAGNYFDEGSQLGAGYMFNWILFSMRILWGYLALGILSYFGFRLCRMRSIQSATGVFYVMVFFVFVGEMISTYLFYQYGLYI